SFSWMVLRWMEFQCEAFFVAEPPLPRQHFFRFCGVMARVLLDTQTLCKLFFQVFQPRITWIERIPENSQPGPFRSRLLWRAINYQVSANVTAEALAWDAAAV